MDETIKKRQIYQIMHHSSHRVGIVFEFTTLCNAMMTSRVNAKGNRLSIYEGNAVIEIMTKPGITSAELCKKWKKTRGFISQIVTMLEKKGIIEKVPNEKGVSISLYLTAKGIQMGAQMINNEQQDASHLFSTLLDEGCTLEDLQGFYKVMDKYISVLREGKNGDWSALMPDDI